MLDIGPVDLLRALAIALIVEGALYAAFPDTMRQMLVQVLQAPRDALRLGALLTVTIGLGILVLASA